MPLSPLLARYDHVILDLDGCVWVGDARPAAPPRRSRRCARPARGSRSSPTTRAARPRSTCASCGRSAIQASLERGRHRRRRDPVRAGRATAGRRAYVIGSAAIFRHVADAGQRIVNGTPRRPRPRWSCVAGHDELHFSELRDRDAGRARRRRDDRRRARPDLSRAGRPWPGHRRDRRRARVRHRAHRPGASASPSPRSSTPRSTGSGRAARWSSATASTPIWPAPRRPASTPRSCSAASPPRRGREAAGPGSGGDRRGPARARARRDELGVLADRQPVAPAAGAPAARCRRCRRALARAGLEHRVDADREPRSRPRAGARRPPAAGEIAVAFGGDGLIGAVAGALRGTDGVARRAARRPRQRLRPRAGHPARPGGRLRGARRRRESRRSTSARSAGGRSSASPAAASTPTPTGSPTRPGSSAATSSTPTARCGRCSAGSRRLSECTIDGEPPRTFTGLHGRGRQLEGLRRRHAARPRRLARRRTARRRDHRRRCRSCASCACCPSVFNGGTSRQPEVERRSAAASVRIDADRPFTLYADGDPIAELPVDRPRAARPPCASCVAARHEPLGSRCKIAAARAVGQLARRAGRGGGTSLPGKVLIRLEPARDRRARRAPAAGQRGRSRRPTARRRRRRWPPRCSSAPGISSSTTAPGRTWPAASPRRCLAAARRGGADRRRARAVRGRRVLARPRSRRARAARRRCSATCSAISSTATASSRRSPTAGRPWSPACPPTARLVLNADDPLIADLGRGRPA